MTGKIQAHASGEGEQREGRVRVKCRNGSGDTRGGSHVATLETTLGQMAPPKSQLPLKCHRLAVIGMAWSGRGAVPGLWGGCGGFETRNPTG